MKVSIPPLFAVERLDLGNPVWRLAFRNVPTEAEIVDTEFPMGKGYRVVSNNGPELVIVTHGQAPAESLHTLRANGLVVDLHADELDLTSATWLAHPQLHRPEDERITRDEVLASWRDRFRYTAADPERHVEGLRPPQLGALHAVQAHWAVSQAPATIVMPTGTGKTDTMISILVSTQCNRLLVVVPTDALRTQITHKFISLGVLKQAGVLAEPAYYPIVCLLAHRPRNPEEVEQLFSGCNVIVATMAGVGQCDPKVQARMASMCSHLFIDEAHHAGAPTWNHFRAQFEESRIVQFTATPYRNDEKLIGGKIVFNYPLRQAQHDEYFRPITFKAVVEFDPEKKDLAIAAAAVEQLRADYDRGHIVMARVDSVRRAAEVLKLYAEYPEFNPVAIHTGIKSTAERSRLGKMIRSGEARIVVCVDMLGEGFDLPELKIAAFHDVRKSLPVTLQLAGRFTRERPDLGNATFIANIADLEVKEELRKLYQHDVDWNQLLPVYSDEAIEGEFDLFEFIGGFRDFPEDFSLHSVRPAMSMVAYHTRCAQWNPDNFRQGIPGVDELDRVYYGVNKEKRTLVVVTTKRIPVEWARVDEVYTWDWQLYVLVWNPAQQLLFIHNSSNAGMFKKLAEAVAGPVDQVTGPEVFRCFAGVNRLRLQNVGLLEQLGRLISFTMRAGSDVEPGLTQAQIRNTKKSNIFGVGFENGGRTTIGCSYKGRIWSRRLTNLEALTEWCHQTGAKLIDNTIDPEEVLRGTLVPVRVSQRPAEMPIGVEWPEAIYLEPEKNHRFFIGDRRVELHNAEIRLVDPSPDGDLVFAVGDEVAEAEFRLELFRDGEVSDFRIEQVRGPKVYVEFRAKRDTLTDYFTETPPTFWFVDGSSLTGNMHVKLRVQPEPYPAERIEVGDWDKINLQREAQGVTPHTNSIQYRLIETLKRGPYNLIFDDDGSGESADVVAIRELDTSLDVEFYHCKYAGGEKPGHRVNDLYEVCGQAQKSVKWMEDPTELFLHLLKRDPKKKDGAERTRYEVGDQKDLLRIREKSRLQRVSIKVFVVQPGISRAKVSREQLELLAVTENYLMETFKIPFAVIASE
jgi:superfamily II DNA or RNA helicase